MEPLLFPYTGWRLDCLLYGAIGPIQLGSRPFSKNRVRGREEPQIDFRGSAQLTGLTSGCQTFNMTPEKFAQVSVQSAAELPLLTGPLNLADGPQSYRAAATVQLFYWNN